MADRAVPDSPLTLGAEQRVLVVLCTYNEASNLPTLIERLHACLPQADLLVVDDSSPDGTGEWVRQQMNSDPQLHLLSRPRKQGLGAALRAGMRWCLEREYDYLINLDADWSHRPADAPALLQACQGRPDVGGCDVAVGSRYRPGGGSAGLSWRRRLLSRSLNGYATWLLGLPLSDCSGSFRCYRMSLLRQLDFERLTCAGYGFLEEILVHLQRLGCRFCEVPIVFETRSSGRSKLGLSDAWGALRVIHRLAFSASASSPSPSANRQAGDR